MIPFQTFFQKLELACCLVWEVAPVNFLANPTHGYCVLWLQSPISV